MYSKVLLVIPARYASKRLPGKPLKKIGKKTMIQTVYERAKNYYSWDRITDEYLKLSIKSIL